MPDISEHAAFIRANTSFLRPPLVPAIELHLADEAVPLWQKTEEELHCIGLPPPFWAFAWAGGQALARYVMDHPSIVRNRSVLDLASGSGLIAIAAAMAGASAVLASDIDSFAAAAIALNAARNAVPVEVTTVDLLASEPSPAGCCLGSSWPAAAAARSSSATRFAPTSLSVNLTCSPPIMFRFRAISK